MYHLGRIVREKLAGSGDPRDRAVLDLTWDYPTSGPHDDPDAEAVLREINGWGSTAAPCPPSPRSRPTAPPPAAAGSTAAATPARSTRPPGASRGASRSWVAPEWAGPGRPTGASPTTGPRPTPTAGPGRRKWWRLVDEQAGEWTGEDVPDFPKTKPPDYEPPEGAEAEDANRGDEPFIMQVDGRGALFVLRPPGRAPARPLRAQGDPLHQPAVRPAAEPGPPRSTGAGNRYHPPPGDPLAETYPYVFTTYRLTEHHTAGGMSRFQAYLAELQPEMFCEVSPELAAERAQAIHGGWATIVTARAAIEARVMVTDRVRPLTVGGRTVHQAGLPYHWGHRGLVTGDAANDLSIVLDPNVHIQEAKAATCDIRPGRRPRGAALPELVAR